MKQEKTRKARAAGIWYVVEPIVGYWLVTSVALACFTLLAKNTSEYRIGMSALAMLFAGVFSIWRFRGEVTNIVKTSFPHLEQYTHRSGRTGVKMKTKHCPTVLQWLLIVGTAVALSLCMNLVVLGTGMAKWSESYQQVEQYQYAISLVGGVLFYGLLSPIVEELIFRGLTQTRLQKLVGIKSAIVLSALFFGAYHGNWIQGVYACVMGVFFASMYQQYKSLVVPIVLHSVVNLVTFTTSYTGIMQENLVRQQYFWICLSGSIMGIVGIVWMIRNEKKRG